MITVFPVCGVRLIRRDGAYYTEHGEVKINPFDAALTLGAVRAYRIADGDDRYIVGKYIIHSSGLGWLMLQSEVIGVHKAEVEKELLEQYGYRHGVGIFVIYRER